MAKKFGMKVYEFGFGFPPRAFGCFKDPKSGKWTLVLGKGKSSLKETVGGGERLAEFPDTLYSINWLPLGGFVKIKGESGEARNELDSFAARSAWQRLVVLLAGVVMNFFLAAFLLSIGLMIGLPTDFSQGIDSKAIIVKPPQVLVQQVQPDSPASSAGIQFGDRILKVNGLSLDKALQMIEIVRESKGQELKFEIARGADLLNISVLPRKDADIYRIGTVVADAGVIRYPWYLAIWKGVVAAVFGVLNILFAFFYLIKNFILGQGLAFDVAGPVGIAQIVGQSAQLGIHYIINVTAMISLSLAVMNVLPIPALDGGRALFVIIEKIIRRPVSMKYEQLAHTIGFILLLVLIVVVTMRDVRGLF